MTDEYEEQLKQLFNASDVDSPDEGFTRSVMEQVRQYQRRLAAFRNVACLGLLVIAWFLAPHILSSALTITVLPGQATLSMAGGHVERLPLLFFACVTATAYLLLKSES